LTRFRITVRSVVGGRSTVSVLECRNYQAVVTELFRLSSQPRAHGECRELMVTDNEDPATIRLHVRTTEMDARKP
jgi:hypothetical protein